MSETWSLFRYRSINGFLWQELELAEFYCSLPTQLNDPFDCGVDWARSIERALGSSLDQKRRQSIELIHTGFLQGAPSYRGVGICCFSVKADDHLMWAHYAASHRGVCLEFSVENELFCGALPATYCDR